MSAGRVEVARLLRVQVALPVRSLIAVGRPSIASSKLNRIVWRQWIRHPTTYAHRVCLRYLSAYRRIEILKSSYTQNETKNQYFQQRFEQYSSNKTSDNFWSWFFDDFVH
jgi:hypothetical protein